MSQSIGKMTSKRFPILKEKNHWICRILGFTWLCLREFFVCNSISFTEEKWGYFWSFIWKSVSRSTFLHFYSKCDVNLGKGWKCGDLAFAARQSEIHGKINWCGGVTPLCFLSWLYYPSSGVHFFVLCFSILGEDRLTLKIAFATFM